MTDATPTPEPPEHTDTSEATFGMKRAAEVAGISVSTIRRNKERLRECGAEISPHGWKVPMSALVVSGLMRRQTPADNNAPVEDRPNSQNAIQDLERVRDLERELLELRHRAELAEERQRSAEQQVRDAREMAAALAETLKVERRMLTNQSSEKKSVQSSKGNNFTNEIKKPWWKKVFN